MKKLIFSILGVLVATIAIQAQTILTSQSFESGPSTGWSYTTNPAAFSVGTDIWDTVTTLSSVTTMPTDATHFWGVQDLANGNGGTATGDSGIKVLRVVLQQDGHILLILLPFQLARIFGIQ